MIISITSGKVFMAKLFSTLDSYVFLYFLTNIAQTQHIQAKWSEDFKYSIRWFFYFYFLNVFLRDDFQIITRANLYFFIIPGTKDLLCQNVTKKCEVSCPLSLSSLYVLHFYFLKALVLLYVDDHAPYVYQSSSILKCCWLSLSRKFVTFTVFSYFVYRIFQLYMHNHLFSLIVVYTYNTVYLPLCCLGFFLLNLFILFIKYTECTDLR